jgi:hypothetical protein
MAEEHNSNQYYKFPNCAGIFVANADLQKHLGCFGDDIQNHEYNYRKVPGRIEHGYGEE